MFGKSNTIPDQNQALPGRDEVMSVSGKHFVNGSQTKPPFADNLAIVQLGLGCFWGAEKLFWTQSGVVTTAVGYAAGSTKNPNYKEVCTGITGHNEVVLVVFDPAVLAFEDLLAIFWQSHNPTQGMRQGNDRGTQYRSAIYFTSEQQQLQAETSRDSYQLKLDAEGYPAITTEILPASEFYYAEENHQQYLSKNPAGYCNLSGTGVS